MKKIAVYLGLFSERGCINAKEFRRKVIGLFANKYTCGKNVLRQFNTAESKVFMAVFSLSPIYLHLTLLHVCVTGCYASLEDTL
jgi:hypothetical protein